MSKYGTFVVIAAFFALLFINMITSAHATTYVYAGTLGTTGVSGSDNNHFYYPYDTAIDSLGNIYVADYANCRIQRFTSNLAYAGTLGVTNVYGSDNSHFSFPYGVAVDSSGSVYVADLFNERIQKFVQEQVPIYGGVWLSKFKNIILKAGSAQNIGLFEDCAAKVPATDDFQNIQQGGSYEFSLYVLNTGTAPVYITYLPTDVNTNGGQTRFHITVNVIGYGLPCEMIANNIPLPAGVSSLPFALPEKDITHPTSGFPLNPNKMIKLDITVRVDSIDLSGMSEMGWNIPFEVVSVSV